jgi:small conductance mechanosensitive channel
MKQRFDELGIEIPFPQTTVSFAEDKTGQAAPLRMRIERGAAGRKALPGTGTPPHRADVGLPTAHDAGLRRDDADELEDVAGR